MDRQLVVYWLSISEHAVELIIVRLLIQKNEQQFQAIFIFLSIKNRDTRYSQHPNRALILTLSFNGFLSSSKWEKKWTNRENYIK